MGLFVSSDGEVGEWSTTSRRQEQILHSGDWMFWQRFEERLLLLSICSLTEDAVTVTVAVGSVGRLVNLIGI